MKRKHFLGIAIIVAMVLAFAGCDTGGGSSSAVKSFTVKFDADNGTAVDSAIVLDGSLAEEPKDPAKSLAAGFYTAPPASAYIFEGWFLDDALFNFSTPITGNITLIAKWSYPGTVPTPEDIDSTAGDNIFLKAINYANASPDSYTLVLDGDVSVVGSTSRALNQSGVKLTITGDNIERTISISSPGRLITIGASSQTGIELIIGNNITLQGRAGNDNSVVRVQDGGAFTMLDGSKVTGNTSSAVTDNYGYGSAVIVFGASSKFTMKGGIISGNRASTANANYRNNATGGVRVTALAEAVLEGGVIRGNTVNSDCEGKDDTDVMIDYDDANFTLQGSAEIGVLALSVGVSGYSYNFYIASDWTGSVDKLDFHDFNSPANMGVGIRLWRGKTIVTGAAGYTLSSADIARLPLGGFYQVGGNTHGTHYKLISDSHTDPGATPPINAPNGFIIADSGADVGVLVVKE